MITGYTDMDGLTGFQEKKGFEMFMWERHGFFGGDVVVDFVNTVEDMGKTRAESAIPTPDTAIRWGEAAGLLSNEEAARLTAVDWGAEMAALHALREALWRVLCALADGTAPEAEALRAVEQEVRAAVACAELTPEDGAMRLRAVGDGADPTLLRRRIALATLAFLPSEAAKRLKECGRCTGLFVNAGRGPGRRWCRMETCGNREKAARHAGRRGG